MKKLLIGMGINLGNIRLAKLFGLILFSSTLHMVPSAYVNALPQNPQATPGSGAFTVTEDLAAPSGPTTTIDTSTTNIAIDWNSFNIASGETVNFNFNSTPGIAFNRVINGNPTEILGALNSNGQVFLSNPSGILFGSTAQINVAGLLATGLELTDPELDNALLGNTFALTRANDDTLNASVRNRGVLTATDGGSISLVGSAVSNEGLIVADLGEINLISGRTVMVSFEPNSLFSFQLPEAVANIPDLLIEDISDDTEPKGPITSAVSNSGTVQSNAGKILMEANVVQDLFTQSVNNSGIMRANKVTNVNGVVRLSGIGEDVRNSGEIYASGGDVVIETSDPGQIQNGTGNLLSFPIAAETTGIIDVSDAAGAGGTVSMTADKVGVLGSASISANGSSDGGTINLQADLQREAGYPDVPSILQVSDTATLSANSTDNGLGGTIILWAKTALQSLGNIFATGGVNGGDGGTVQTGAGDYIEIDAAPDVTAANGASGSWQLDQSNISVDSNVTPPAAWTDYNAPASTSTVLDTALIKSAMDNGTSVSIFANSADATNGDINIDASIAIAPISNNSLSLTAANDIAFNNSSSISASNATTNTLDVSLSALAIDLSGADPVAVTTNGGNFNVLQSGAGSFDASSGISTNGGDYTINANQVLLSADVNTTGGDFNVTSATAVALPANISTAGGNIAFNGSTAVVVNGTNTLDSGAGSISLNGVSKDVSAANNPDNLILTSDNGTITLNQDVATSINPLDSFTVNGGNVTTTSSIFANSISQVGGSGVFSALTAGDGGISLSGSTFDLNGVASTTGTGGFTIVNSGDFSLDAAMNIAGSFNQSGGGKTLLNDNITSSVGSINFTNEIAVTNTRTLDASVDVTVANLTANNSTTDNLAITTNNNVTLNGSVGSSTSRFGDVTVNATNATINGDIFASTLTSNHTGQLAVNNAIDLTGEFAQTNGTTATTVLANDIVTAGQAITFNRDITVNGTNKLETGNGVGDITLASVTGDNLSLLAGTGNVDVNGQVGIDATQALGDLVIVGELVNLDEAVFADSVSITHENNLTVAKDLTLAGGFAETGNGATNLSGNIFTNDGITFNNALTLNGNIELNTGADAGDISLGAVTRTNASDTLTLSASGGAINLNDDIASVAAPLNAFTVNSGNVSSANAIFANGISQTAGSGTYATLTAGSGGIGLAGTAFTLNGIATTADTGLFTVTHSGALNINGAINSGGAFSQSGGGQTNLAANITTTNDSITFGDTLAIDGTRTLSAGAASISVAELIAANDSTDNLVLNSSDTVNFNGAIGSSVSRFGDVTVNATNATINGDIFAGTLTSNHTGQLAINNAIDLTGEFAQTNGTTATTVLANDIVTVDQNITFDGEVSVVNTRSINTGSGLGNISFAKITGGSTDNLSLNAGTGNVSVSDDISSDVTAFGNLSVAAKNVNFDGLLFVNDLLANNSGTLTLNRDIETRAGFNQIGVGSTQLNADIESSDEILFTGEVLLTGDRRIKSLNGGTITLSNNVTGSGDFELDTSANIALNQISTGSLSLVSGNDLLISDNISLSEATSLSFQNVQQIVLISDAEFSVVNTSGTPTSIKFNSDNKITGANQLTLTADNTDLFQVGGSGLINPTGLIISKGTFSLSRDVEVDGVIDFSGAETNLFASRKISASGPNANISLGKITGGLQKLLISNTGNTQLYGDIAVDSISFGGSTGDIELMDNIRIDTTSADGIDFSKLAILGADKQLTLAANSGALKLGNVGLELSPLGALNIENSGDITLAGNVYTNDTLDFNASVLALASNTTLESFDGSILIGNTIDGSFDLSMSALNSISTADITNADALNISANNVNLAGDIKADSVNISLTTDGNEIALSKSISIDTSSSNGDVLLLNSNITGTDNTLSVNAGSGKIGLGNVGRENGVLGGLIIAGASDLNLNGNIFTKNGFDASNATTVNLLNDVVINTNSDSGTVKFGQSALNGEFDLRINSQAGKIQLASVGNQTALRSILLNNQGDIDIGGEYRTIQDFQILNTPSVNVQSATNITSTNGSINMANASLDGTYDIVLTANEGTVSLGDTGTRNALESLNISAKGIFATNVSTSNGQFYSGDISIGGDLIAKDSGGINISGDTTLTENSKIEASGNIDVFGAIDGNHSLVLSSGTGNLFLEKGVGGSVKIDSFSADANMITVASVNSINDISISAKGSVIQNGSLVSDNGDVTVSAESGLITMASSSSVLALEKSIQYSASGDIQLALLEANDISVISTSGTIESHELPNANMIGDTVTLSAAAGIYANAFNSDEQASMGIITNDLSIENASGNVNVSTQSKNFNNIRPETNPLQITKLLVANGNYTQTNTGGLQLSGEVNVSGNLDITSSSQLAIDKNVLVANDIDVSVGKDTVTTGLDGLTLNGNLTSTNGNIDLVINDLVDLKGEISALNGNVTVISEQNSVAITHINAGNNKATVSANGNINALDSNKVNIIANNVELSTEGAGQVGSFGKPVELSTSETILSTINGYITGRIGIVTNEVGVFVDPGVAVSSGSKGQSTSAQEFSFVDATVFSKDLNLFDVVNEGIRLPDDQLEDEQ